VGHLIGRGIRIAARGTWMLSAAHTDDDVDATLEAVDAAVDALVESRAPST
jgi:glutamate-1-semialdehyde aminotransferase